MTEDYLKKHKESFLREAHAHVENMSNALLKLEKKPTDTQLLHEVFRSAHTLKSIAATMGYDKTAKLSHAIEDLLAAIRDGSIEINQCTDILFVNFDFIKTVLKEISADNDELDSQPFVEQIQTLLTTGIKPNGLNRSEQAIISSAIEKIYTIEVKVERLDILMNLAEELLVNRLKLDLLREGLNNPDLTAAVDILGRLVTEIQYNIMQIRLVPIGFVFNRFPRMVRDLAKYQKKEVELIVEGGDIELDRSLLDEIGESLAHLIRNAIDHGLETPEMREKANKNPKGIIRLTAKRTKEFVTIEVCDDGSGLDTEELKKIALKNNLLKPNATIEEIYEIIFKGVTTTKEVTSVSGRGLGLSIVRQKIESIGGSIRVVSKLGEGTTFIIKIPLTLAVIKVLFVKVSDKIYAIPLDNIDRLLNVLQEDFKGMLNYAAIVHAGEDIPVIRLAELFQENLVPKPTRQSIVVVRWGDERLGLGVDSLLSTQEVVIKPLSKLVKLNKLFSGSVLIGSGEVVLIIDIPHLFLAKRRNNEERKATAT